MIKIDIERSGFPVVIGEVELWFDSSLENIKSFANAEEIARSRLKEVASKAEHIHFPENLSAENIKTTGQEEIDEAFSMNKEFVAIQYDVIFGDGTFKKLYEVMPDLYALEKALDPIGEAIGERLEEEIEYREQMYGETKEDILDKKKQKQQKK